MICEDGDMDTTFASNLLAEMERALREERPDLDVAGIMEVARFAAEAHGATGVVRRYTGVPYIEHPVEVAMIVARAGLGAVAVKAALLHDVLEETPETLDELRSRFGDEVAVVVDELTEKATLADGNREARKRMERERLAGVSALAKSVKYADTLSTTPSIAKHDRKFARVYVPEKRALLSVMVGGDATLFTMAVESVEAAGRAVSS
jgi:(p)ppGpp synthase/HD superfamily hydrolase